MCQAAPYLTSNLEDELMMESLVKNSSTVPT
ncbi:hypothetical protein BS78_05G246200 [Paspalum vaginatum]|nr:hypothetical protein BS78_05G246200 [Paspalum vaginatum]